MTPTEWKGKWLQDPRFDGLAPIDIFCRWTEEEQARERIFAAHQSGLSDVHLFLRKEFTLVEPAAHAQLRITADDYYKLYVNGRFVGQGPANSRHDRYYVNTWDVLALLRPGENVLAAHVHYLGLLSRAFNSFDHRMGLVAELQIRTTEATEIEILSDESWKGRVDRPSKTLTLSDYTAYYDPDRSAADVGILGSNTSFREDLDSRTHAHGWREVEYDDSSWFAASAIDLQEKDYLFVEQPTPPVSVYEIRPASITRRDHDRYLIDFGMETVGQFGIRQPGRDGHLIEIRHGEELNTDGSVRHRLRCSCDYQENWTLSDRAEEVYEPYDWKGFRYVEVLGATAPVTPANCWATTRHYPFPDVCHFQSSSSLLDRIWKLCRNAVKLCSQEVYVDCPQREKGQYLGDLTVATQAQMLLTADYRLARKGLVDFALSSQISPGLMTIAPGSRASEIADYSLQFPMQVNTFYDFSGDRGFLRELLPHAEGMLDWFRQFENDAGLIQNVRQMWNMVDHPPRFCDEYDFQLLASHGSGAHALAPAVGDGPHNVVNAFYCQAIRDVSRMREALGMPPLNFEPHRRAFEEAFYEPSSKQFVDAVGSRHAALHSNVLPLLFELAPAEARESILALVARKRMVCSVYFSYFVLRSLYESGHDDLAFDLITSRDVNSWHTMLEAGATAAMEAWAPEQKSNNSFCHAWGAAPIIMVSRYMMGFAVGAPGWATVRLDPHPPRDLEWALLEQPLPQGIAQAAMTRDDNHITYEYRLPPGVGFVFPDPRAWSVLEADQHSGRCVLRKRR